MVVYLPGKLMAFPRPPRRGDRWSVQEVIPDGQRPAYTIEIVRLKRRRRWSQLKRGVVAEPTVVYQKIDGVEAHEAHYTVKAESE